MTPFEAELESSLTNEELLVELLKWVVEKNRIGAMGVTTPKGVDFPDELIDSIVENDEMIKCIIGELKGRFLTDRVRDFLNDIEKTIDDYAILGWDVGADEDD